MKNILDSVSSFEKQLTSINTELLEFHYHPSSFGSWYIVLRKSGKQLRVVYDGKESQCFLQALKSQDNWYDFWSVVDVANWVEEVLSQLRMVTK